VLQQEQLDAKMRVPLTLQMQTALTQTKSCSTQQQVLASLSMTTYRPSLTTGDQNPQQPMLTETSLVVVT
jgi:hypothetical protein